MLTQRHEEKSAAACSGLVGAGRGGWRRKKERPPPQPFGSSFYMSFPPPGLVLCKLGQPGVLSVLPEVLTLVLGPFFVLFLQAFLLSFSHHHFGLLFPILTTEHSPLKRWEAQFFGNRGVKVFLATSC